MVNPSTKKGGTLTFALSSTPDSFDPGNTYYAWTFDMTRLWATPLVTYKSCPGACGNTLVPGIATSLGTVSEQRPGVDLPPQAGPEVRGRHAGHLG